MSGHRAGSHRLNSDLLNLGGCDVWLWRWLLDFFTVRNTIMNRLWRVLHITVILHILQY